MKRTIKKAANKVMPGTMRTYRSLKGLEDKYTSIERSIDELKNEVSSIKQHDFRLDRLRAMIKKVEPYQPTYGISEIVTNPQRNSLDRCRAIERYFGNVAGMRLLDIGSSLGYVCYYFADRGVMTEGWEHNPDNAEVSRLVGEVNGIYTVIKTKSFDPDTVKTITPGKFDMVTILSVLHHVIHYNGLEYTQKLIEDLMTRVPTVIVELAKKGEDPKLFWDKSLPKDELSVFDLVKDKVEIHKIGEFNNHLSNKTRPVYVVSLKDKTIKVNNRTYEYNSKSQEAYRGSEVVYSGLIRRYYMSPDYVIKEYAFDNPAGEVNMQQIIAEISNLLRVKNVRHMPELEDYEINSNGAKIVLKRIKGDLLSDLVSSGKKIDPVPVAKDLLDTLADLEKQGLHHNDVRSWNTIYNKGKSSLIDFGFVSHANNDDDMISLMWVLNSVLSGVVETPEVDKKDLPEEENFSNSHLLKLYEAVGKGERSATKLLKLI